MAWQQYPGLIEPRPGTTQRNFERATYGGHAAAISAARGHPFIPWQRYAMDTALEVDEHGVFVYPIVIMTIQRQAGKTDIGESGQVQNALLGPDRRVWSTAQTGQDAADKWGELADTFENSKLLRPMAYPGSRGVRRSNGSQSINFINGSKVRPHPPTRDSLHGKQSDRNDIDEAWAFTSAQGADLKQAIGPTTTTRRMLTGQRTQLWIYSTEGTIESTFLNPLLEQARAGDPEICLVDFGLRDDEDPTDLDLVARRHPGFGFLLDMATLRDQQKLFADAPGEFARAFGNRRTGATERVIPVAPWKAAAWLDEMPAGRPCLAAAVGIDGVDVSIAVGIQTGETVVTALVNDGHRLGTNWALTRMKDLSQKHPDAPWAIARRGPSAGLRENAERAGLKMLDLDGSNESTAHGMLLEGITSTPQTWRYRPHEQLDLAAELATRRYFSDGAWVFGRRASVGSISAVEAASLAGWGACHLPEDVGIQLF